MSYIPIIIGVVIGIVVFMLWNSRGVYFWVYFQMIERE